MSLHTNAYGCARDSKASHAVNGQVWHADTEVAARITDTVAEGFRTHLDEFAHGGVIACRTNDLGPIAGMLSVDWELSFEGQAIGSVLRELHEEGDTLEAHHVDLQIWDGRRPPGVHGVALALWGFALQRYRVLGIGVVRVKADCTGAYLWAKTDLCFAEGWDANCLLKQEDVRNALEGAAQMYGCARVRDFLDGAREASSPRELLDLDADVAKAMLLVGRWDGVLRIR